MILQIALMRKYLFHFFMTSIILVTACNSPTQNQVKLSQSNSIDFNTQKIITEAENFMTLTPITITDFKAERSSGGNHDYYSEGLYWWANPDDPDGPFIRKDGQRNPNNFREHKNALREFCKIVTTLTAAYQLTNDEKYAHHAIHHIQAWFANPATKMNPSMLYAQAIKGISTGRGIGIIDTVRLINVAISILYLEEIKILRGEQLTVIKKWFDNYSVWLTSHPYGMDERDNNNNHSTWWGAQVAAFAKVAGRDDLLKKSQIQFKEQLGIQMAEDGSFPNELDRTKPFHYMNYNLRAWTSFALLASTPDENLWEYESKNGTLQKAIDFMVPFYNNPNTWKYFSEMEKEIHPERNDFLLFAYWGIGNEKILELWKSLETNKNPDEDIAREENLVIWDNKMSG